MNWLIGVVVKYVLDYIIKFVTEQISKEVSRIKSEKQIDQEQANKAKEASDSRSKSDEEFDKASRDQLGRPEQLR